MHVPDKHGGQGKTVEFHFSFSPLNMALLHTLPLVALEDVRSLIVEAKLLKNTSSHKRSAEKCTPR